MRQFNTVKRQALSALTAALILFFVNIPATHGRITEADALEIRAPSELSSDLGRSAAPGDTIYFGFVDEDGFAVEGETWTWDHGSADLFEGWTLVTTSGSEGYFRHLTEASWTAGGSSGAAPLLNGAGSAWLGLYQDAADGECWTDGTGYGNSWSQLLRSPVFTWNGTDPVTLSFEYFNDSEEDFDNTCVQLRRTDGWVVELDCLTGQDGISGSDLPTGEPLSIELVAADFGASTTFEILFSMTSDGGWSDEDGLYTTQYGPFGVDDIVMTGGIVEGPQSFDFETGLQGWTPEGAIGPNGDGFLVVRNVDTYDIPPGDFDDCRIEGNVLAFHDENEQHNLYTHQMAISPPVNLGALEGGYEISALLNKYGAVLSEGDTFFRIGWDYYPAICEVTGAPIWSGRVGPATFFSGGHGCLEFISEALDFVPAGAEQVRMIFELVSGCGPGEHEPECSDNSDFSPILDNVRIRAILIDDPADAPLPDLASPLLGLERSTPNPFGASTTLSYSMAQSGPISLSLHDSSGRRVRTLIEGMSASGIHARVWDGLDDAGRPVPAGVYWSRLEAEGRTTNLRIVRVE